jgi:hypothetical protein
MVRTLISNVTNFRWTSHQLDVKMLSYMVTLQIISAMRTLGRDRSETSFVIEEAKNMTRLLGEWNMSQVKREGNEVANALASLASRSKLSEARGGGAAPACVGDPLTADFINVMPS